MHLLEIKALPYPQNLFADLGVSDADKVNVSVFEAVLAEIMQKKEQRNLDILHAIYRGNSTYSELAVRYGVTRERIRQIRGQLIRFLRQPCNMLMLQACVTTTQPIELNGEQLWLHAVAKHKQRLNSEHVPVVTQYLKTAGVIFPAGQQGIALADLISPCTAETLLTLSNVHVTSLISVWNLGIESTITRCLLRSNIKTLRDLLIMSGRALLRIRGLSAKRTSVIAARLAELGIAAGYLSDVMNTVSPYTGAVVDEYAASFVCLTRNTEYTC